MWTRPLAHATALCYNTRLATTRPLRAAREREETWSLRSRSRCLRLRRIFLRARVATGYPWRFCFSAKSDQQPRREETDGPQMQRRCLPEPRDAAIAVSPRASCAANGVAVELRVERGARPRRTLCRDAARRAGGGGGVGHRRMTMNAAAGPFGLRPPRLSAIPCPDHLAALIVTFPFGMAKAKPPSGLGSPVCAQEPV